MAMDERTVSVVLNFALLPKKQQVEERLLDIKLQTAEAELSATKKTTELIESLKLDRFDKQGQYDFLVSIRKDEEQWKHLTSETQQDITDRMKDLMMELGGLKLK